jgi:hypothetical protein
VARIYIEYLGDSVELPIGETVVGRDVGCALRFNDPAVSRRHLRFIRRQGDVFVEDLGSANGTLLNGRKVAAAIRVRDRDVIVLGSRELTLRVWSSTAEEPPTMNLRDLSAAADVRQQRYPTSQLPITVPPPMSANQRCPRCGAAVSSNDEECANCKFKWGTFRPTAPTHITENPLSRRRHERHSLELHLVYVSSELEIEATTRDLSESGVFVCSEVLDPLGTECQLTILVDGGPPLHIQGVVRRVVEHKEVGQEPTGLGIEFVNIGAAERAWLKTTVAHIEERELADKLGAAPQ